MEKKIMNDCLHALLPMCLTYSYLNQYMYVCIIKLNEVIHHQCTINH